MHKYTKTIGTSARLFLGIGGAVCTLIGSNVPAKDVVIAIHVSTQGLDMSQPAHTRTLYTRLEHAAWVACTDGNRVGLEPSDEPRACYEKALAGAIRSANVPMLTQIYMSNHTLHDAVAFGIPAPLQIAAK